MESTEKPASDVNGSFRKCGYPYCRNMAKATDSYCELHQHSKILVKHPGKKNPPGMQKAKKLLKSSNAVKAQIKKEYPEVLRCSVTIRLTVDEALDAGFALALAKVIDSSRFIDADKIGGKILKAIIRQIPAEDLEEES